MKQHVMEDAGLDSYRAKRNFSQTREPPPRPLKRKKSKKALTFVIQKHDATRLHYDFRLEMEGVLKSWAVPKGIPTQRGQKHLAVHVEDHPMNYASFEGTIPEGNYGAGTVMVWDEGTYETMDTGPIEGLKNGKLHIQLRGAKLQGEWALVRIKPRQGEKESWLLFKGGENAPAISAREDDRSVQTGRTLKQIAEDNDAQWKSGKKKTGTTSSRRVAQRIKNRFSSKDLKGLPAGKIAFVSPMKCRLAKEPPTGDAWFYEIKFDGFRVLALKQGQQVQLLSRSEKDLTARFPEIAEAIGRLPFSKGIVDGEIVALDEKGRSSFQMLQMSLLPGEARPPLCYYLFDIVNLEGKSLVGQPLSQRKELLRVLVSSEHDPIRYSGNILGDPRQLLREVRKRGLEGIIAKQKHSKYEPGLRTGAWVKNRIVNEQEFVIGGFTEPKGSRDFFGAILVGYFEKRKFVFASKVGSGFNQVLLKSLHRQFQQLAIDQCPFVNLPEKRTGRYGQGVTASEMKRCSWVKPELVAQVHFTEWTRDGHLRHPVFMGLREDKKPAEVVKENAG